MIGSAGEIRSSRLVATRVHVPARCHPASPVGVRILEWRAASRRARTIASHAHGRFEDSPLGHSSGLNLRMRRVTVLLPMRACLLRAPVLPSHLPGRLRAKGCPITKWTGARLCPPTSPCPPQEGRRGRDEAICTCSYVRPTTRPFEMILSPAPPLGQGA